MATGHVDLFFKMDGIKGESQDKTHKDEMEVLSYDWGMHQTGGSGKVGTGGGAGKVNVHDFTITKSVDAASPKLMEMCCSGKHIPTAVLTCRKAGGDTQVEFLVIKFADLLISSVTHANAAPVPGAPVGGTLNMLPTETVSINFTSFETTYKGQDAKGGATGAIVGKWNSATSSNA